MTTPTDDELRAWFEDYFRWKMPNDGSAESLRTAVRLPTLAAAEAYLRADNWEEGGDVPGIARSLRKRFPRPIDEAVLRACDLKPSEPGSKRWQDDKIEAWPYRDDSRLWCVQAIDEDGWFEARTADRFAAVCEALRTLHGENE